MAVAIGAGQWQEGHEQNKKIERDGDEAAQACREETVSAGTPSLERRHMMMLLVAPGGIIRTRI